ncbi:MAG: cyclic nucleotide-binding domain-containing protein [Rhodobacteraceae bacterium]|nr:cyclic nucleotide-binding domain-containing protein [Paracoccaceae bacterium]
MSLVDDISTLQKIPMLSNFGDDQLRLLAFSAETLEFRDGMRLFDEGDRADGGLVIANGRVSMQQRVNDDYTEVDVAEEGTLLGETAMLVDTKRPCRAIAIDHVRVIRIRRALFKRMMQEYPELARGLFEQHAARYQRTANAIGPIGQRLQRMENELENQRSRAPKDA